MVFAKQYRRADCRERIASFKQPCSVVVTLLFQISYWIYQYIFGSEHSQEQQENLLKSAAVLYDVILIKRIWYISRKKYTLRRCVHL